MKALHFPLLTPTISRHNLYIHSLHGNTSISHNTITNNNISTSIYSSNLSTPNVTDTSCETSLSCSLDHLNELKSLDSVKLRHAQFIKIPKKLNTVLKMQSLVTSYLAFGDFQSAVVLFFVDLPENYLYWSTFFYEFKINGGNPFEILDVFSDLHHKGFIFDSGTLRIILKLCTNLGDTWLGLEVHACLIKRGFDCDVYLRCALMNFYGKCGNTENANLVFDESPDCDCLLWNEAVMVNLRSEKWTRGIDLFREMQFSYVKASSFTLAKVLKACSKIGALDEGKQIHGYVFRLSLESNLLICNSLISMYCKCGNHELARVVFDTLENRNLSSWNSIISGYSALGYLDEGWSLFHEMKRSNIENDIVTWNCLLSGHFVHGSYQEVLSILRSMQISGFKPNSSSITSVLQAISELGFLKYGKEIHGYVVRNGLDFDIYVETSLLDMYVKNNDLISAHSVFDSMNQRNIFAWNSLISGYSFKGRFEEAEKLLMRMESEGIVPDLVTYNGLVSGYSIGGQIDEALAIIRQLNALGLNPNVVSWTALISGCSQNGNYKAALEFFTQMQQEGIKPNTATISCVLQACAGLSMLCKGKEIHALSTRNGFIGDIHVTTTLIDMYSKCGSIKTAYEVFCRTQNKNLATWNSMITGLAIHSLGKQAISLFKRMQAEGFKPDVVTFTALLSSCKASGLIDEGWRYFDSMSSVYGINRTIEHYSCMVDLLGKSGYLDEAWELVKTMPIEPDAAVWGALLGSCRVHCDLRLAEIAAKKLFKLEPYNPANYVLLTNVYEIAGRFEAAQHVRDLMDAAGVKVGGMWSWIEINQKIHAFYSTGRPHPDEGQIYFELYKLVTEMKKSGYVPDTKCVYKNIDKVEKEKMLLAHTEKLAITYGLMKMKSNLPIRVIKNTRMCSDCHTAAKYISQLRKCEIFVKDGIRFHHFSCGKCSCNDFW